MGTFIRDKINNYKIGNINKSKKNTRRKKKNDGRTSITIDGFVTYRNSRLSICAKCATTTCMNPKHRYICTSAGYWFDIKKKYNWKIMGHYRLVLWVRKQDAKLYISNEY
jgi:hypothetical protein